MLYVVAKIAAAKNTRTYRVYELEYRRYLIRLILMGVSEQLHKQWY
jgi:hypothetical protein